MNRFKYKVSKSKPQTHKRSFKWWIKCFWVKYRLWVIFAANGSKNERGSKLEDADTFVEQYPTVQTKKLTPSIMMIFSQMTMGWDVPPVCHYLHSFSFITFIFSLTIHSSKKKNWYLQPWVKAVQVLVSMV